MTRPLRIQYPGAYYHVTSRGNERKNIFRKNGDRKQFLSYLKSAYLRYGAVIHVFCLMNNHYHLLLETPKGNLSQIMLHINGAYTNYFNIKHKRRGHLFQGRYKAILIEADSYAGELSRYIHLNPVRASLIDMPEKYKWSSHRFYLGRNNKPEWLRTDFILGYFEEDGSFPEKRYQGFVNAKLYGEYESPLKETAASTILGTEKFIEIIRDKYVNGKRGDRDLPALAEIAMSVDIDEVYREIYKIVAHNESLTKKMTLYLCLRYNGMKLKDIGKYFNISESAVSEASKRFDILLKKHKPLRKNIETARKKLNL